jgi:hypothetical protein
MFICTWLSTSTSTPTLPDVQRVVHPAGPEPAVLPTQHGPAQLQRPPVRRHSCRRLEQSVAILGDSYTSGVGAGAYSAESNKDYDPNGDPQ